MSTTWRPGHDHRAVRHPGQPGAARVGAPRSVAVVGGGIAGLAAATVLAERGVDVTVLEREATLGGRVRAWPRADGRTMSRGFHAFFRQYYTLRALLRRADPGLRRLVALGDYPLQRRGGARDSFARVPRTSPWGIAAFVWQSPTFRFTDLARVDVRAATELLRVRFPATFHELDGLSAADVLDRLRFPEQARDLALEVFARSFFADPADFSGAELVAMFSTYFLNSGEGLLFDVPDDDYDTALWAPLGAYLRGLGADVRPGVRVEAVERAGTGVAVTADGRTRAHDAVVLATDVAGLQSLVAGSDLGTPAWRADVAGLRRAPAFVVWRLWLDRPVAPGTPAFLGTSGWPALDNVSVVSDFEAGARAWAARTGGSVVELHAYAANAGPDAPVDAPRLRAELWQGLTETNPELAGAGVVADEWVVGADCPVIPPRGWAERPGVTTPDPAVVLAGDGIRCEWPVALMERAAVTGVQAANALLDGWGVRGEDLWSPPLRGLLA